MTIPNYVPLHIHYYLLSAMAAPAFALLSGGAEPISTCWDTFIALTVQ